jgi:energy-coupling factor transporter ATP-binding protein EcfA2
MTNLTGAFRTLLEAAQAEAKRLGHCRVTEAHLSLSVLKRYRTEAQECWPGITEDTITNRYLHDVEKGDRVADPPPELVALIERASSSSDWIRTLCKELKETLHLEEGATPPPVSGTAGGAAKKTFPDPLPSPAPSQPPPPPRKQRITDPAGARAFFRERIVGQDGAVDRVINRLIVTRADLDLKPQRPDGVFLLAGPTGVGKTEFAKVLAGYLHPEGEGFIRLDMSEYRDGHMALAKLIGSGPGYVGYDEPGSWLTSKILQNPDGVLLLDEIEKAHPEVWTLFLQVFDEGRLTDGRGRTADFSNIVVVMTSNLGARAFDERPFGFRESGDGDRERAHDVVTEIRNTLPIELFNRIDEVIVFHTLGEDEILDIARRQIESMCRKLKDKGYEVELEEDVVRLIAQRGYEPALGARHLLRNIERLLLAPIAQRGPGRHKPTAVDGELAWG